jgi:hypothetical protein
MYVDVGGQCGGAGFDCYKYNTCDQFGPWARWCCPNGYSCQPVGQDFRLWTCQVNVQDSEPGELDKLPAAFFLEHISQLITAILDCSVQVCGSHVCYAGTGCSSANQELAPGCPSSIGKDLYWFRDLPMKAVPQT